MIAAEADFAIPEHLEAFLLGLPNVHGSHTTRTLLDHLAGTYRVLKSWGSPDAVCLAGLFHSIYGTQAYHTISLTTDNRQLLEGLIGPEAEALVHAFHLADWSELLSDPVLVSAAERETPGLSELAVANLVEQVPRVAGRLEGPQKEALKRAAEAHLALEDLVSDTACRSLRSVIVELS